MAMGLFCSCAEAPRQVTKGEKSDMHSSLSHLLPSVSSVRPPNLPTRLLVQLKVTLEDSFRNRLWFAPERTEWPRARMRREMPINMPTQHTRNVFTHLQNLDFKVVKMNIWKEERDLWEGRESHKG